MSKEINYGDLIDESYRFDYTHVNGKKFKVRIPLALSQNLKRILKNFGLPKNQNKTQRGVVVFNFEINYSLPPCFKFIYQKILDERPKLL